MLTPSSIVNHRKGQYPEGDRRFRGALAEAVRTALMVPRRLTGVEWAEEHGVLPRGTGAETGRIKLWGYQRGLLNAMCDPRLPRIVVKKSARVGYTRLALLTLGYYLDREAASCLFVQPTVEDVEDFSRLEIEGLLRDTSVLAALRRQRRQGETQDTITDMQFRNGAVLRLRGAKSDDAFRRYSARLLIGDEIDADGWAMSGTKSQGDKFDLMWKRGETYWNRKMILGSTPLLEGSSRVQPLWESSNQLEYFVPCPHCHHGQYLEWGGPDVGHGLKWSLDSAGKLQEVWYTCRHCGSIIEEKHKVWMDSQGMWLPTGDPDARWCGFNIWTAMSLFANASWFNIVDEFLEACKDPVNKMQTFVNLTQGRIYTARYGDRIKAEKFAERLEAYPQEVPDGVLYLTAGGDVQSHEGKNPRLEVSVYGWGAGNESWLIGHWIISGDPRMPETWNAAESVLRRPFLGPGGRQFSIASVCWDSGGHNTAEVYDACATRRGWYAIKGRAETMGKRGHVWPRKPTRTKKGEVYMIGGNAARDYAYASLGVEKPGPRYVHFPQTVPAGAEAMTDEFFNQLTAERLVHRKGGYTEWEKNTGERRKEAGVCYVYAYCALTALMAKRTAVARNATRGAAPALPAQAEGELADAPVIMPPLPVRGVRRRRSVKVGA